MTPQSSFTRRREDFTCLRCATVVHGNGYTNHCPQCLWSRHVDVNPGDRAAECGAPMEPVGALCEGGEIIVVQRCVACGHSRRNRSAPGDDRDALLGLFGRPVPDPRSAPVPARCGRARSREDQEDTVMAQAAEPPSGTRDFLADEVRRRTAAFDAIGAVFERYGFDPLETPAFERLEVFAGKLGEEASALIFKILKRGVHEASGEADLALRYDHTVPLARVVGTYGNKLPSPYKRYAIGPVWRADRAAKGRFREFAQCDIDTVGSASPLADAEIIWAVHDGLNALGIGEFQVLVNSRQALRGLLEAYGVADELGDKVLGSLDKLDKLASEVVCAELVTHGLPTDSAETLVADLIAPQAEEVRKQLDATERGRLGLAEVDRLLELTAGLPAGRVVFTPRMVRGLDYYTGLIFEVTASGYPGSIASGGRYDGLVAKLGGPDLPACGGSIGIERILALQPAAKADQRRLQVALTVLGAQDEIMRLAAAIRAQGLRTGVYLGSSSKLARQLAWAHDQRARLVLIYGPEEQQAREVTVRDMDSGAQTRVGLAEVAAFVRQHS
jgi:histidyl-tRNA synthetase